MSHETLNEAIARHELWLAEHEEAMKKHDQAVLRHDKEIAELRTQVGHVALMLESFIASMTGKTKNGKSD